ncbi:hypothetical protein BKA67DRAFT_556169 [Truncatella angustata]|uniref:Uncharacterized protein n=1 Tax=Truncatella angustata TaxID=152316 RepID=A0A9P8USY9_9PEZI|nr:uncharacterized protein BKA67DRAFT_556169 [Truncatella angustata]KAH6657731.1 hypothetical protein BKA67DRAFT_556169 [Truncatella angustata]
MAPPLRCLWYMADRGSRDGRVLLLLLLYLYLSLLLLRGAVHRRVQIRRVVVLLGIVLLRVVGHPRRPRQGLYLVVVGHLLVLFFSVVVSILLSLFLLIVGRRRRGGGRTCLVRRGLQKRRGFGRGRQAGCWHQIAVVAQCCAVRGRDAAAARDGGEVDGGITLGLWWWW